MLRFIPLFVAASCAAPLVQFSAASPKGHCGQDVVVIGAVAQPGKFDVRETRTLLQALDRAGGFTAEAHPDRVVIERCAGEQWEDIHVLANRVSRGGEGDLTLKDGDIVHVPAWD
jgi:protein involved in polysaccharide export with SLBB domain